MAGGVAAAAGGVSGVLLSAKRVVDRRGQLHRIAVTADMHVERQRVGAQQVIMHGGDLEAVRDQLGHHRIDLGLEQHEIAHHHRPACIGLNAAQPPSAKAGLMVTPSSVTCRSVRGKP